MHLSAFEYHRADDVEHALELLQEHPEAELLAGGHSLLPTMKSGLASPDVLVDISELAELRGIDHEASVTRVGAMTTYATIADSQGMWNDVTVVADAAREVGDIQVRNKGTIGGNIAHADPASDPPAAVLAADATIHARGPDGERTIPADAFFHSMYATALDEDEILTAVTFPNRGEDVGGAYVKKPSPSSGYALVGVAAAVQTDGDGTVSSARLAATGATGHATRLEPVEDALAGEPLDGEVFTDAAARAADGLDEYMLMDDLQASAEYRAHLLTVYAERALTAAAERAGEATVSASDHRKEPFSGA
jgi:carbon-monoxide dehydrogenase medium subunit